MEYIGRIEKDKKMLESQAGIILFGAGKGLFPLLSTLEELHVRNRVVCICDNYCGSQGREIDGIRICSLDEAMKYNPDSLYIVYNRFCKEISRQLLEKGITKIHLIRG